MFGDKRRQSEFEALMGRQVDCATPLLGLPSPANSTLLVCLLRLVESILKTINSSDASVRKKGMSGTYSNATIAAPTITTTSRRYFSICLKSIQTKRRPGERGAVLGDHLPYGLAEFDPEGIHELLLSQ